MRRIPLVLVALSLVALAACSARPEDAITLGGNEVRVYVADSQAERSQGLQGYDELADGEGMLFIFDDLVVRRFTMKDVTFPIDVVFVAEDLTVSAIVPLNPGGTDIVASPSPSPYVLELPQGWAADHGIAVGAELSVPESLAR